MLTYIRISYTCCNQPHLLLVRIQHTLYSLTGWYGVYAAQFHSLPFVTIQLAVWHSFSSAKKRQNKNGNKQKWIIKVDTKNYLQAHSLWTMESKQKVLGLKQKIKSGFGKLGLYEDVVVVVAVVLSIPFIRLLLFVLAVEYWKGEKVTFVSSSKNGV